MKIDPVIYNKYSEDEEFASSEEIREAFYHLFSDTTESIMKEIAECVDECEDELPNEYEDNGLPMFSSYYLEVIKPQTKQRKMNAFIASSKKEVLAPVKAEDFSKMNTAQQYQYLVQAGIHFCMINKLPHVYCRNHGIYRFIQTNLNGAAIIHKELPSELRNAIEADKLIKLINILPIIEGIEHRNALNSNQDTALINFKDGIYNVFSDEIIPHSSDYTFLSFINASVKDIHKEDNKELLDTFLYNSFGDDQENLLNLQEMCGVAFSTIRNQKIAFFLHGPSNTGKSAIQSILKRFIGDEFCSSLQFSQLNEKFSAAHLAGKVLNLGGEIPTITTNSVDRFKSIVGNDTIHVEHKGQIGFDILNYALMTFSCNNLPKLNHHDEAFYSRMRIIQYTRSIAKAERINNIDGRIYKEARGEFIRFAIEGLKRFIENGCELSCIDKSDAYVSDYMCNVNSFSSFASECIMPSPGGILLSTEIIAAYEDYCNKFSLGKPLHANVWYNTLLSMFDTSKYHSAKTRGYNNLRCTYFTDAERKERGYI